MALLDLDKIIIKRTVIGVRCAVCGGNLVPGKKSVLTALLSLCLLKARRYECEQCKKKYLLL